MRTEMKECKETHKISFSSEAKAYRSLNKYEDIKRVYYCEFCEGFHLTSQSLEQRLEYGELSLEEENKLLREKINKMEGLTTSITRLEVINKDRGREKVIRGQDITLSLQDDMTTLKVFYGYGELDELKHF